MAQNLRSRPVAVIGLGLLGHSIAACYLCRGFTVTGVCHSSDDQEAIRASIRCLIEEAVQEKACDQALLGEWPQRFTLTTDIASIRDCGFVIESVTEDPKIKQEVFDAAEAVIGPEVVIATNTSAIPISQLQTGRKHPERFLGMHWSSPAHATRFLELIRGDQTSDDALATTAEMARLLGKEPALCEKDVPGFIVNRLCYAMYREALHLLESGVADAATIDLAMRNALGLWADICGPLRWIDISGGPELYAKAMRRVLPTLSKADTISPVMDKLAAENARGSINGRGFYHYDQEEAKQWAALYRRNAWRLKRVHDEYFPLDNPPS